MLTDDEIESLRVAFEAFSRSTHGDVDPRELWQALNDAGCSTGDEGPYLREVLEPLVSLEVPSITFEEFHHLLRRRLGHERSRYGQRHLFDLLDREKKGYIGLDDLKALSVVSGERSNFTIYELKALFSAVTRRKDYHLNFDEFAALLQQLDSSHISRR